MSFIFFRYRQRLFFSSDINNLHFLQLLGLSKLAILIILLLLIPSYPNCYNRINVFVARKGQYYEKSSIYI